MGLVASLSVGSALLCTEHAHATGPVERLVQVLRSPSNPDVVVVRYGVASEGYLFSRDGGRTFKAMCSQAITPQASESDKLKRISSAYVPSTAATLVDARGQLLVSQIGGLWSDDGQGCSWTQDLVGLWPTSLVHDPADPNQLLAIVNASTDTEATSQLYRRSAAGAWSPVGALVQPAPNQRAYGGGLLASADGQQLYATVNLAQGDLSVVEVPVLVASSDGGKTWAAPVDVPMPMAPAEDFVLLAVDPSEPRRILAGHYRDLAPDTLVISQDGGKTFTDYQQIQEISAVTFAPDGRLYVADAGDSSGPAAAGGLWTASKLGEPLSKVEGTQQLDCAQYDPSSQKLFVCQRDKFGLLDPVSGAFDKRVEINTVESLIECPGADVAASCSSQLNAGASWCCAGHYPFTPFCGQYDVTMRGTQRLFCGVSGRAYDQMVGRGPADAGAADAGQPGSVDGGMTGALPGNAAPDAGAPTSDAGRAAAKSDDGCSLSPLSRSSASAWASLSVLLVALVRRRRARS